MMSWALWSTGVLAATWTVDPSGGGDATTIGGAIDLASSGDTISIAAGTYAEEIDAEGMDLTLEGDGPSDTIINGSLTLENGETTAFTVKDLGFTGGDEVVVVDKSGVTFENVAFSLVGGGVWNSEGSCINGDEAEIILDGVTFEGNSASYGVVHLTDGSTLVATDSSWDGNTSYSGSAIYAEDSTVELTDCEIENNYAYYDAGGIYLDKSSLTTVDCTFSANFTAAGSGNAVNADGKSTFEDQGSEFSGNYTGAYGITGYNGGAVWVVDKSTASFTNSTFSDNFANGGGHLGATDDGELTLDSVTLENGWAYQGGSVYVADASLFDTDSEVTGSTSYAGGAYFCYDAEIEASGITVDSPYTYYYGGAYWLGGQCKAELSDITVDGGTAGSGGVGFYLEDGSELSCETCEITGASAVSGGAVFVTSSTLTLSDSTVSGNEVTYYGGGLYGYASTLEVSTTSFAENVAASSGGAIYVTESELVDQDNAYTDNEAAYGGGIYAYNEVVATVSASTFTGNVASGAGGGIYGYYRNSYQIDGCDFEENESPYGGAFYSYADDDDLLQHSRFDQNVASTSGGAVYSYTTDSIELYGNRFHRNEAGSYGGAVAFEGITDSFIHHNVLLENAANNGGGLSYRQSVGDVVNNHLLGNEGVSGGAGIYVDRAEVEVVDNVLASQVGDALYASGGTGDQDHSYNSIYDSTGDAYGGTFDDLTGVAGNIDSDCLLVDLTLDLDVDNDNWHLGNGSPCEDAGSNAYTDPDGSDADLGVYGGDESADVDFDRDGWTWGMGDCHDNDADVYPGATETWYDGVDGDCDGGSDYDQDGDTFTSDAYAGLDCDDTDPDIYPGADEVCDDGVDNDCDDDVDEGCGDTEEPSDTEEPTDTDAPTDTDEPTETDTDEPVENSDTDDTDWKAYQDDGLAGCTCESGGAPAGVLWPLMLGEVAVLRRQKLPSRA